jgi:hypothetical protein
VLQVLVANAKINVDIIAILLFNNSFSDMKTKIAEHAVIADAASFSNIDTTNANPASEISIG